MKENNNNSNYIKDKKCIHHNKTIKFICLECNEEPVCSNCYLYGQLHSGHEISEFNTTFLSLENKNNLAPSIENHIKQNQYIINELESKLKELENVKNNNISIVKEQFKIINKYIKTIQTNEINHIEESKNYIQIKEINFLNHSERMYSFSEEILFPTNFEDSYKSSPITHIIKDTLSQQQPQIPPQEKPVLNNSDKIYKSIDIKQDDMDFEKEFGLIEPDYLNNTIRIAICYNGEIGKTKYSSTTLCRTLFMCGFKCTNTKAGSENDILLKVILNFLQHLYFDKSSVEILFYFCGRTRIVDENILLCSQINSKNGYPIDNWVNFNEVINLFELKKKKMYSNSIDSYGSDPIESIINLINYNIQNKIPITTSNMCKFPLLKDSVVIYVPFIGDFKEIFKKEVNSKGKLDEVCYTPLVHSLVNRIKSDNENKIGRNLVEIFEAVKIDLYLHFKNKLTYDLQELYHRLEIPEQHQAYYNLDSEVLKSLQILYGDINCSNIKLYKNNTTS